MRKFLNELGETGRRFRERFRSTAQPRYAPHNELAPPSMSPTTPRSAAKRLGHFRIDGTRRCGGMGEVYKGFDETLGRTVAIKVLPTELGARWIRPSISRRGECRRQVGSSERSTDLLYWTGWPFSLLCDAICRRRIAGRTLAREGRLSVKDAVRLFDECLQGLGAAHRQGLIHRDIKPGTSQHGTCDVGRFWAGSSCRPSRSANRLRHDHGDGRLHRAGTSPWANGRQSLDLYSLGVLLYQLLAGRLPFEADSLVAMLYQHTYEQPFPLEQVVRPMSPSRLSRS